MGDLHRNVQRSKESEHRQGPQVTSWIHAVKTHGFTKYGPSHNGNVHSGLVDIWWYSWMIFVRELMTILQYGYAIQLYRGTMLHQPQISKVWDDSPKNKIDKPALCGAQWSLCNLAPRICLMDLHGSKHLTTASSTKQVTIWANKNLQKSISFALFSLAKRSFGAWTWFLAVAGAMNIC